jgi:hypothetical protein
VHACNCPSPSVATSGSASATSGAAMDHKYHCVSITPLIETCRVCRDCDIGAIIRLLSISCIRL